MLDLQEIQILAQLLDNMDITIGKLEKAYNKDDDTFSKAGNEILDIQNKLSNILK